MRRTAAQNLLDWVSSENRKPLVIEGVRRVGKTWLMERFAEEHFEGRSQFFRLDTDPAQGKLWEADTAPERLLETLAWRSGRAVQPGELLVFDGVNLSPKAIDAIGRLGEARPDLHLLLAAASPVHPEGGVDVMTLEPMSFTEFLLAQGETGLAGCLQSWSRLEAIPGIFFDALSRKFWQYQTVGGMPEAAAAWCGRYDLEAALQIQDEILEAWLGAMMHDENASEFMKMHGVWSSIPGQLARDKKRFRFSAVEPRSGARKYGDALRRLTASRMVRAVRRRDPADGAEDPLSFKLYPADTGLLMRRFGIAPQVVEMNPKLFRGIRSALAETAVLQGLAGQFEEPVGFWSNPKPQAEVDFLVSRRGRGIPIEVDLSERGTSPGLRRFMEAFGDQATLGVRFSTGNLKFEKEILSLPLFMAGEAWRLIDLALEKGA